LVTRAILDLTPEEAKSIDCYYKQLKNEEERTYLLRRRIWTERCED